MDDESVMGLEILENVKGKPVLEPEGSRDNSWIE
jgi:hypothetical protein